MFLSRRASIRAFVDAQAASVSDGDTSRARDYQRVALVFLQPAPPRLMAVGGLSGSGKTTTALRSRPRSAAAPGAVVVRSDVERKRLAGVALEERMPAGSYTPDASAKTYAAMFERAERVLRAGHSVVLDAVFAKPEERPPPKRWRERSACRSRACGSTCRRTWRKPASPPARAMLPTPRRPSSNASSATTWADQLEDASMSSRQRGSLVLRHARFFAVALRGSRRARYWPV